MCFVDGTRGCTHRVHEVCGGWKPVVSRVPSGLPPGAPAPFTCAAIRVGHSGYTVELPVVGAGNGASGSVRVFGLCFSLRAPLDGVHPLRYLHPNCLRATVNPKVKNLSLNVI